MALERCQSLSEEEKEKKRDNIVVTIQKSNRR